MVSFFALLLRLVLLAIVTALIAGATLMIAAERVPTAAPTLATVATGPKVLVVPDVTGQAYVFAKGLLQESGFAWHVYGSVHGYAANIVTAQIPAGGTKVYDTGAPLVTLSLVRNPTYQEQGTPDDDAPYSPTALNLLPGQSLAPGRLSPTTPAPTVTTPTTPTLPVVTVPTPTPIVPVKPPVTVPAPTVTRPAPTTPAPTPTAPVRTTPAPAPAPTPTPSTTSRGPDFVVPGAPKEPATGLSLPDRAAALARWLEAHKQPSAVNLNYWLYEHAYIVAGAKFGWWHGSQALLTLISVDQRAESLWGVGAQSEQTARKALAEVQAKRT